MAKEYQGQCIFCGQPISTKQVGVGGLNAYFEISDEMLRWCYRADTFTGYLNRIMLVLRLKINRKEVTFLK